MCDTTPPRNSSRRALLRGFLGAAAAGVDAPAGAAAAQTRVRPGGPGWPTDEDWAHLGRDLGDALIRIRSPWPDCIATPSDPRCAALFGAIGNPYFIGDDPALTQTLGWVDAWTSTPSAYAVAARNAEDVAAAVDFARERRLRLVVKGGGHSYQGTSCAPDSLLVWTRRMNAVTMHEAFVAAGCEGKHAPVRAVTVGAGALWAHVYDAVTTRAGGYVQGGGCTTVGVAGLVQSGGFGSFSKAFGLASASLLEAQVVTADGVVRIASPCVEPELFWALKGGGGGSLGVLTRLTLRVHELPQTFGAVNLTIRAGSASAYRRLIGIVLDFCATSLIDPHWGEQIRFRPNDSVVVSMVFQGLDRAQAKAVWQPLFDEIDRAPKDFRSDFAPLKIVSTSARTFWSPTLVKRALGLIKSDDRPGAPAQNMFWPGDQKQAGHVMHGYQSAWLPAALLERGNRQALGDALFAASRHWGVSLHLNKGLAGAAPAVVAAARDTAMNPSVLDAFALAICGAEGPPAYPGIAGREPDQAAARHASAAIALAMAELRRVAPDSGSYLSESNYFEADWQRSFWGANYPRLLAAKRRYDPQGLFFVHHGVGSEDWSADGFSRL